MTEYAIRPATAADSETIIRMVRSAPLNPNAVDWRYFLVLEIMEDEVPKIASIGMLHPEGDILELDSVTTDPAYRRQGYAAAVVQAWIVRTPQPIYLLAETELVGYYERLGFRMLEHDESPRVMIEQVKWLNNWLKGEVVYHIMGNGERVEIKR